MKEYGMKVCNLYISQVKRNCGEVGENYNLAKSGNAKQPNCAEEYDLQHLHIKIMMT